MIKKESKFEKFWFKLDMERRNEIAEEVASLLGSKASGRYIYQIARGMKSPSKAFCVALSAVTGIKKEWIMFPEDNAIN